MRIAILFTAFILLFPFISYSQKDHTTVGLQIKPIFPVDYLGTGKITNDQNGVHFETLLNSGFSAGMVVRHNFTNTVALETGINYVKRKYSLTITDSAFKDQSTFRIIGYEIPLVFMVYAQVGEKLYVNGSMGPVLDMFASSIKTYDDYFQHVAFRNHTIQPAILANVGVEYRTEKSGNIYIGASFQKPFSFIYLSQIGYYGNGKNVVVVNELSGSYLTIDLRYFFPETKSKIDLE